MPLDFQSISAIVFLIILSLYVFLKRKELDTHGFFPFFYFSMYRTKFGLSFMDKLSKKYRKTLIFLGYAGIVIGFLGMALLSFSLVQNLYTLFTTPDAAPGVGLVLPFKVKGAFFVPFFYWIISIFIIALVHEYAHGVIARAHNIKVKSSGFAFLGILIPIIPAAFVEPDEKALRKRPYKQQLSVFAAGPFANILLAFIVLGLSIFVLSPIIGGMVDTNIEILDFIENDGKSPTKSAGVGIGESILEIDGILITNAKDLSDVLGDKGPRSTIKLKTDVSTYSITLAENPDDKNVGFLGVSLQQELKVKDSFKTRYGSIIPNIFLWIVGLFRWLIILNLGIGLFNLVPIGPLDGGRMMQLALRKYFNEKKADKYWHHISMVFLFLVIVNIAFAFIK